MKSPFHTEIVKCTATTFTSSCMCTFVAPSHALISYNMYSSGMPLYEAVGLNCKKVTVTDTKAQVTCIWAKG